MFKFVHKLKVMVAVVVGAGILLTWQLSIAADRRPLIVGATVSLDGQYSITSRMIQKGYRLWEAQINQSGGLLGRQVKLLLYNDKSQPGLVKKYYQKLIVEDGAELVLSPYGTPLTLVASEISEKYKMVMLAVASAAHKPWARGYRYLFGLYALADRYFISYEDIIARRGYKTLAIIYYDSVFHQDIADAAATWASRFGLKVHVKKAFSDVRNELPELAKLLKNAAVDGVIFSAYPLASYEFLEILKKLPYRPRSMAMTIVPTYPDFYDTVGVFAEGIFGSSQWEPDERIPFPGTAQFIKDFKAFTGMSPSYHAGSAYASCKILENVISSINVIDHEKIRSHVAALDTLTVIGRFKVDQTGRQVGHNPILIQWQKGKKEIVYPRKMKTKEPLFDQELTTE